MIENVTKETLETILDTLPIEFSFIDHDDTVRIFNKNGDRIFPRPRTVIGRKVQDCHPPKSLHKVQQIIQEMKKGTRDTAEFWIDHRDRKIHIRYFAVRDINIPGRHFHPPLKDISLDNPSSDESNCHR